MPGHPWYKAYSQSDVQLVIGSISEVSRVVSLSGFENFFREGLSVTCGLDTVRLGVAWTGFGWSMAE